MKWAYVFVYDEKFGTREEIKNFLDSRPEVLNWYYCMSNSFFLVSNKTATTLQQLISGINKNNAYFIILDAKTDKNGWLPRKIWEFLNTPKGVNEP